MKFIYKPITNSKQMGKRRKAEDIRFLVIHDTGNESRGADAMAHYRYLQGATRPGSAHYYVDDKEIIQTIGDSRVAWAVGDTWARKHRTRSDVNNANSLSVELCINRDGNKPAAYKNLVELTKNLMARWHISADHVVRHFDASGKPCPGSWQANNWAMWRKFQADIRKPREWPMDLTRSSDFGTGAEKKEEGKDMEKRD
ncbi:MAG: peptidoglycan recognition family protein, partial [Peptoniphilus sp.]